MNDKQREEFERWTEGGYVLDKSRYGEYMAVKTNIAWQAWQAAISSVVVELPTLIIDEYENGDTLEYVEMSELKEPLDKAGIRYE